LTLEEEVGAIFVIAVPGIVVACWVADAELWSETWETKEKTYYLYHIN
jgi:hypothetical protein